MNQSPGGEIGKHKGLKIGRVPRGTLLCGGIVVGWALWMPLFWVSSIALTLYLMAHCVAKSYSPELAPGDQE